MLLRVYAGGFLATVGLVVVVQSRVFALARALVDCWHFRLGLYILTAAFGVVPAVHWTHLNLGVLQPLIGALAPSLCAFLAHFAPAATPDPSSSSSSPSLTAAVVSEPDLVYAYLPYVLLMYTLSCLAFSIYLAKVCTRCSQFLALCSLSHYIYIYIYISL